ncbi:hypothetical protein Asulf_01485 [Archaeoglobus sulfaticallidus PM70-1]|uniref:Uncharacterized protein n=1 Tax=Archaeoglobus sulfaticallidus PM70-1 TaxID=387631 RepID=N0BEN7_9EURY|nr:hypothetical protein [Archaeoglobus sulfaticallidus]AGK61468.1 hypothetical protein Asulf_01485 [Archaeoglobus sulfaticallidus PM70-1]
MEEIVIPVRGKIKRIVAEVKEIVVELEFVGYGVREITIPVEGDITGLKF